MSIILKALQRAEQKRWSSLAPEGSTSVFWAPVSRGRRMREGAVVLLSLFLGVGTGVWSAKAPGEKAQEKPKQEERKATSSLLEAAIPEILSGPSVSSLPKYQESPPPTLLRVVIPKAVWEEKPALPQAPQAVPGPPSEVRDAPSQPVPAKSAPAATTPFLIPTDRPPTSGEPPDIAPAPVQAAVPAPPLQEPERKESGAPQGQIEETTDERKRVPLTPQKAPSGGNPIAEAWVKRGKIAEQEGRLSEAITHFLTVVRLRSGHAPAHAALGRLYSKRGDHILAINEFHLAAQNAPADPEPLYALSVLYARLGSTSFAREHLEKAISRDARIRERALRDPVFSVFLHNFEFQALLRSSGKKKIGP